MKKRERERWPERTLTLRVSKHACTCVRWFVRARARKHRAFAVRAHAQRAIRRVCKCVCVRACVCMVHGRCNSRCLALFALALFPAQIDNRQIYGRTHTYTNKQCHKNGVSSQQVWCVALPLLCIVLLSQRSEGQERASRTSLTHCACECVREKYTLQHRSCEAVPATAPLHKAKRAPTAPCSCKPCLDVISF